MSVQQLQKSERFWSKVLFFPVPKSPCYDFIFKPQGCQQESCMSCHDTDNEFYQLIQVIMHADKYIDISMYSLTCKELADAVLRKFNQGVQVRLVTDTEFMNKSGSKIADFFLAGINVRHHKVVDYYMHHKFIVVDQNIVVMGSANWTQAAFVGNNENVIVSNYPDIVQSYNQRFNMLWKKFDCENTTY